VYKPKRKFVVMCGNVGTGKSVLARRMADSGAIIISEDAITTMVAGGNYDNYHKSEKELYHMYQNTMIELAVKHTTRDIVCDCTNLTPKKRSDLLKLVCKKGTRETFVTVCCDFGKGDKDSLARRMESPKGLKPHIWQKVHEKKSLQYESPGVSEGFDYIEKVPTLEQRQEYIHAFFSREKYLKLCEAFKKEGVDGIPLYFVRP